ncbi:MAG: MoxR family ATPase [Ruminococcaceae bacterium]|nr:MoxR family ATPase [Oscillospiraceae bacterium]
MKLESIQKVHSAVTERVKREIVGKEHVSTLAVITLLCGGHMLIDDVPGTGKTVLAKTFAEALSLRFTRIQCVPDMLPSDIVGVQFFDMKQSEFRFIEGPVFTNILLADEINRAMPKTQSGLLECMEEDQVTVEGVTRKLEQPFMVIATQNPIETKGTFDLPEAQLDRFLIKTSMGYPTHEENIEILSRKLFKKVSYDELPRVTPLDVIAAREELERVYVHRDIMSYASDICEATRRGKDVALGASTRALISLVCVARCYAAINGRDYVLPDDVKQAAVPVLAHRIVFNNSFFRTEDKGTELVSHIISTIAVPSEDIDFSRRG